MAHESSAANPPAGSVARVIVPTRCSGAAGGEMGATVISTRFESCDSTEPAVYFATLRTTYAYVCPDSGVESVYDGCEVSPSNLKFPLCAAAREDAVTCSPDNCAALPSESAVR